MQHNQRAYGRNRARGLSQALRDYCTGLMMPCDRKSVEPMAAITAPDRTAAQHQSLLHFVVMVLPEIERHGPIEAWIIDDTGFPRRDGIRSGLHGNIAASKQDNCQVAVPL